MRRSVFATVLVVLGALLFLSEAMAGSTDPYLAYDGGKLYFYEWHAKPPPGDWHKYPTKMQGGVLKFSSGGSLYPVPSGTPLIGGSQQYEQLRRERDYRQYTKRTLDYATSAVAQRPFRLQGSNDCCAGVRAAL